MNRARLVRSFWFVFLVYAFSALFFGVIIWLLGGMRQDFLEVFSFGAYVAFLTTTVPALGWVALLNYLGWKHKTLSFMAHALVVVLVALLSCVVTVFFSAFVVEMQVKFGHPFDDELDLFGMIIMVAAALHVVFLPLLCLLLQYRARWFRVDGLFNPVLGNQE